MTSSARRFVLSIGLFLTMSLGLAAPAFARDDEAVIAGTRQYLAVNSYPPGMVIKLEKVAGDYARVLVSPKNGQSDSATVFLKREHGTWKGLTLGTGWDPAELDKLHIPKSLQP
jgi:hypothetical protein